MNKPVDAIQRRIDFEKLEKLAKEIREYTKQELMPPAGKE